MDLPPSKSFHQNSSSEETGTLENNTGPRSDFKVWHETITPNVRNSILIKLLKDVTSTKELNDQESSNLTAQIRKLEEDTFKMANTLSEYYHLLAGKIYNLKKGLEEKRKVKLNELQDSQAKMSPGSSQQSGSQDPPESNSTLPDLSIKIDSPGMRILNVSSPQHATGINASGPNVPRLLNTMISSHNVMRPIIPPAPPNQMLNNEMVQAGNIASDSQMIRPGNMGGGMVQLGQNMIPQKQAVQQLMLILKRNPGPEQQQQLLQMLKANPQLMAAFIKQRQQNVVGSAK